MLCSSGKSRVLPVIAMGTLMVLTLWVHATLKSRQEYYLALNARGQGLQEDEALHLERAILWYAPLNGYVYRAAEALWQLSEKAELTGNPQLALRGYRSIRSAFYASRSVYVPGKEWIKRCDQKIARLMAQQESDLLSEKYTTVEERHREHLALLQTPIRPRGFWAIVAAVGFTGWVAAAVVFILRGFRPAGGFHKHRAFAWVALFFLFYTVWLMGMWKA